MIALHVALALARGQSPPCSLNGELAGSSPTCVCDKPWTGPECSVIDFKPVTFPQGYGMQPAKAPWYNPNGSFTTWGGNALQDPATGKFHLFVSAMTNDCPLQTWGKNSRIDHAVADTIVGPYEFVDVAIPTWSHNAAPVQLHDGSYAIFHIGDGTGPAAGGQNCTAPPPSAPCASHVAGWTCTIGVCASGDGSANGLCGADLGEPDLSCAAGDAVGCATAAAKKCDATPGCAAFGLSPEWNGEHKAKLFSTKVALTPNPDWTVWQKAATTVGGAPLDFVRPATLAAAGSTIHVSKSLNGPWAPLAPNTLGGCNNPAPWVHPNGTIYCLCKNAVHRADEISGPWTVISTLSHSGGPQGTYEDPFLYTDARGWHLLYHVYNTTEHPPHGHECADSTVSAHAFSLDGYEWHMSPLSPYGTQVELSNGTTVTIATRERPKMWFNAKGEKTHLFNGACSASSCPNGPTTGCVDCKYNNWDYTLIQPLAV